MTRLLDMLRLVAVSLLCLLIATLAGFWLVLVVLFWILEG